MTNERLYDATQPTAMSKSQSDITQNKPVTPPPSGTNPLTPPHTDKKPSTGVLRVLALFKHIQAGTHTDQDPWIEIQLAKGEYDLIEHAIRQDSVLWGFVEDKIWLVNFSNREDHSS